MQHDIQPPLNGISMFGSYPHDTEGNEHLISMKEWISKAIHAINSSSTSNGSLNSHLRPSAQCSNNERVLAIATDSYLKPALKIAHSLASEICKAEEFSAQFQHSENCKIEISSSGVLPKLPVPSSDWSDRVVIHLSRGLSASCDGLDLQPLPFSPDKTLSDEDDLKAMLNSLVPGDTFLHEGNFSSGEQAADKFSFQNVVTAKFVFSLDSDDVPPHSSEAIERGRRIHSLGLLFYELFSGGQTAAAATSGTKSNVNMEESFDPLPVSQNTDLIDFGSAMNLIGDLEDSDRDAGGDFSSPSQAHDKTKSSRKKSKTCTNGTLSSASIEPLRMQKLPRSLCDLIENMINRIYGDLCGDEVYQNMSDVRDDLLLMIEKPDKFLHDIDLEKVSLSDLHLTETVFGREDEFARLLGSYQRALAGNSEVSIISGQSGTGKSMLAYRFGRFASTNGGLFLSGKFDQLKQSTPFSAIANAFNEYCNIISQNVSLNLSTVMASKLQEALGHEAFHLVKVIPNLRKILGTNIEGNDLIDSQSWVDSRKRLEYLLCQFVAVISSSSSLPIILFLDDLQWADEASIEVIKQLLLMSVSSYQCKQFFFVGCCRGDEMKQDHKIWTVFNGVRNFGVHTEIIELSCMDKETTNAMVSDVLCLSPRLTRPLSDILFHKTKGNPLFFCQIMSSWSKDGLLQLSLHRHRWEWEEERIQSTELPENVAMFFTGTIRNLPNEVQSGLCILSCFGATSTVKLIKLLEQAINTPLFQPLDKAVSEGLLIKRDEKYSFVHDHVQSAAYNLMKPEERCLYHFQYGLALCSGSMFSQDDDVIFTAVGQINRGGPSAVSNPAQGATIANLNLLAGKRAVGMADFKSAFTFFDHGISFLRKNHWKDHYDLSLELFDYAAKCSFFLGDNINLKILSEQILTYARSFHDKLNVMYITVSALSFAAKLPESIEKGIWILSQLGEDIPVSSSDSDIQMHVVQTRLMLNQFQDRDLLNYKVMTDRSKMMAMRFLARLETSLMMAKPSSQAFVTMKMVQLSISHGMSRISPVGFAHFGSLLGTLGNISEGYRYVKLAKQLLGRISGSNEVAGEVLKVSTNLVCFVEPVQSTIEFFKEGFNSSMASGDLITAMECSIYYSTSTFWVYSSLAIVKKNVENTRKMLEQQNHLTFLGFILPMSRTVSVLISSDVSDSFFDLITESTLEHALLDKNPFQWMILSFQKMYISFVFREVDILKHLAEKYFHVSFRPWTMTFVLSVQRFYGGLVSFWLYRQSGDSIWAERGHEAKLALSKWAESSQWNYQNKFYLLEAEDQYSNNDIENAKSSYTKAILSAREHKFINEEALACELAGYFYLSIDDKSTAVDYFTKAHEKYHEWGAFSKTSKLYEFVQSEFSFMQREPTQNSFQLNTQNDVNQGVSKRPSYH